MTLGQSRHNDVFRQPCEGTRTQETCKHVCSCECASMLSHDRCMKGNALPPCVDTGGRCTEKSVVPPHGGSWDTAGMGIGFHTFPHYSAGTRQTPEQACLHRNMVVLHRAEVQTGLQVLPCWCWATTHVQTGAPVRQSGSAGMGQTGKHVPSAMWQH